MCTSVLCNGVLFIALWELSTTADIAFICTPVLTPGRPGARADAPDSTICTVSAPRIGNFRGSIAGLCTSLSTLRRGPTPCRSPGASHMFSGMLPIAAGCEPAGTYIQRQEPTLAGSSRPAGSHALKQPLITAVRARRIWRCGRRNEVQSAYAVGMCSSARQMTTLSDQKHSRISRVPAE